MAIWVWNNDNGLAAIILGQLPEKCKELITDSETLAKVRSLKKLEEWLAFVLEHNYDLALSSDEDFTKDLMRRNKMCWMCKHAEHIFGDPEHVFCRYIESVVPRDMQACEGFVGE